MTKPNWMNRTIWAGDNLGVMRGMNFRQGDYVDVE